MSSAAAAIDEIPDSAIRTVELAQTLDLAAIAQVNRGDRVEVERVVDKTLALFEKTLKLTTTGIHELEPELDLDERPSPKVTSLVNRFVPESEDLRRPFMFAEAVGSYNTLNELIHQFSPGYRVSQSIQDKVQGARLSKSEIAALEDYREQLTAALSNASAFIRSENARQMSVDDLLELNEILVTARDRCECITAILGEHLIREVEAALLQLCHFQDKIKSIQRTIDGIFLVDSELFFIPTQELIDSINTIFKAVGNSYVSEHIDGTLLLAARNMLIKTVSFYSYYGKQQIYNVFTRKDGTANRAAIAHHIKAEIRRLFNACQADNKLVLKRVMTHAEREFEISVGSIRAEAEESAVAAVELLLPPDPEPDEEERPGFFKRMFGKMLRD